ncbi:MAG: RluA family pseudouridine synthase [Pirellulales bacterium]|nr:RluA family pseudouridine synthase [Pirellulales bacterium]
MMRLSECFELPRLSLTRMPHNQLPPPRIIHEDNHLLVLDKPAGWTVQGAAPGQPSLVDWAKADLKRRYHKPGNVYLGVVSRLDQVTSGVIVLARTSKAAARLSSQFANRETEKTYWAILEGRVRPPSGEWRDWLIKNDQRQRMEVTSPHTPHADEAVLRYETRRELTLPGGQAATWLEITLLTGRKHQIRVQASQRTWPIWGDHKYGGTRAFARESIALHARRLTLTHPTTGARLMWTAELPVSWRMFGDIS